MTFAFDHSDEYYRTDLKKEAFDYLDKLDLFLNKKEECGSYWKWIIISFHGALYHFMLMALRNTDGSGIWKEDIRNEKGYIDFSREDEMFLISFMEAFRRIKNKERMGGYVDSKPLISRADIDEAMDGLNDWRNSFIHYKPKGWSIEIEIFKEILRKVLPVLKFIINDCARILIEDEEGKSANRIINKLNVDVS